MFLGAHLDEPVTDKTGLEGGFTFELNWTPAGLSKRYVSARLWTIWLTIT